MKVIKEKTEARKWLDKLGHDENGAIPSSLEDLLQNYANEKQTTLLIEFFLFMEDNDLIHERIECVKTIQEFEKQQKK